jgi:hypothetical protein
MCRLASIKRHNEKCKKKRENMSEKNIVSGGEMVFPDPCKLSRDISIALKMKNDRDLRVVQDAVAEYSVFYYTKIFPKINEKR